jgi:hypothetical protein
MNSVTSASLHPIETLKAAPSECWIPVSAGAMPQFEWLTVVVWDNVAKEPCAAFYDADENCWHERSDGAKFFDGAVTHWRNCNPPDAIGGEGAES